MPIVITAHALNLKLLQINQTGISKKDDCATPINWKTPLTKTVKRKEGFVVRHLTGAGQRRKVNQGRLPEHQTDLSGRALLELSIHFVCCEQKTSQRHLSSFVGDFKIDAPNLFGIHFNAHTRSDIVN